MHLAALAHLLHNFLESNHNNNNIIIIIIKNQDKLSLYQFLDWLLSKH